MLLYEERSKNNNSVLNTNISHSLSNKVKNPLPVTSQTINTVQNRQAIINLFLASFSCLCLDWVSNLQAISSSAWESLEYSRAIVTLLLISHLIVDIIRAWIIALRMLCRIDTGPYIIWSNHHSELSSPPADVSTTVKKVNKVSKFQRRFVFNISINKTKKFIQACHG